MLLRNVLNVSPVLTSSDRDVVKYLQVLHHFAKSNSSGMRTNLDCGQ
jgi:hypothetical protein